LKAIRLAKRELLGGGKEMERMNEIGMFIYGSAATVRARLEEFQDRIGLGQLCTILQFGTLPHELTKKNMELFATEVMPHFRNRVRQEQTEAAE
jgi:alkanesulfonate monooxygenase SsuD/methylene tetrahydromethanopterin reductase-like flavin-dependent oxidoreductase (luciferase family)